jgi:hypothetical protein
MNQQFMLEKTKNVQILSKSKHGLKLKIYLVPKIWYKTYKNCP